MGRRWQRLSDDANSREGERDNGSASYGGAACFGIGGTKPSKRGYGSVRVCVTDGRADGVGQGDRRQRSLCSVQSRLLLKQSKTDERKRQGSCSFAYNSTRFDDKPRQRHDIVQCRRDFTSRKWSSKVPVTFDSALTSTTAHRMDRYSIWTKIDFRPHSPSRLENSPLFRNVLDRYCRSATLGLVVQYRRHSLRGQAACEPNTTQTGH